MSNYIYCNGELYHAQGHKYVKKVPIGNGKYRYYYKQGTGSRGNIRNKNSDYGKYVDKSGNHEYVVKKSNKLFSGTYGVKSSTVNMFTGKKSSYSTTVREVGKLERGLNSVKRQISRGKKKVSKLLKKLFKK